ncbi:hypothetical protein ACZ90_71085 [Streptomyces albus subsp. albus]|nr:hypothetical protein ACZ90_71085 [Streptomyces albus subsp. albus]
MQARREARSPDLVDTRREVHTPPTWPDATHRIAREKNSAALWSHSWVAWAWEADVPEQHGGGTSAGDAPSWADTCGTAGGSVALRARSPVLTGGYGRKFCCHGSEFMLSAASARVFADGVLSQAG